MISVKRFIAYGTPVYYSNLKQRIGISGHTHGWLLSYLLDRKQKVVLPGAVSDTIDIKAGVRRQGLTLGPLLFLNDIV